MSSRDWGALFAAIGLAFVAFCTGAYVTALNYPQQERYPSYRYAPGDPEAARATLADKTKPVEYREPCQDPRGHDETDLCAQWKAARAAEASTLWAARGFWVSGFSILGIVFALFLTVQSNQIARDTAKRELRAFVSPKNRSWRGAFSGDPQVLGVEMTLHNHGNSPAKKVITRRSIRALPYPLDELPDPEHPEGFVQDAIVWPDASDAVFWATADRGYSQQEISSFLQPNGRQRLYLFGDVTYEDVFGDKHKTLFCYFLDPLSYRVTPKGTTWIWATYPGRNDFT